MALSSLPSSSAFLNAQNKNAGKPLSQSDIVVVGGGIHSLIYSIHAIKRLTLDSPSPCSSPSPSITVLEKNHSPGYKIGESTLTTFGLWLKTIGIGPALLWRLFGPKDGLAFYYLSPNDPDEMGTFSANGPPGDFVPTLQIERTISELLLTLYAQRLGVTVLHGHSVDTDATAASLFHPLKKNVSVKVTTDKRQRSTTSIDAKLLVDATGRFRRLASKSAPRTRFPGFNTDAFWAYFEEPLPSDSDDSPFPSYESCNTNHICLPEGWAWIIRLPSWEGSPLPNLVNMMNFLLDLNAKNVHPDEYPSTLELAARFELKVRWVVSIGYALRSDVVYPSDVELHKFGSCEAERKFYWVTSRYERMARFMARHRLITDLYGPKTTWFTRKTLSYDSPVVSGRNWAAIGDAAGFTNPLYSPGINCNMATSVYLAELTPLFLAGQTGQPGGKEEVMAKYAGFCSGRVGNLFRMNAFNYLLMRSPRTGPIGPLWQYLCGTGNKTWQGMKGVGFDEVARTIMAWEWGSDRDEYIAFAEEVIRLLDGPACLASDEVVKRVLELTDKRLRQAIETGKYKSRWAGLLRWYDDDLVRRDEKLERDVLARRCENSKCGNWRILRDDVRRCATCGAVNEQTAIVRYN